MGEPVRVLHVLGGLSLGGAESRVMDLYRCMDREKVQFDFLIHRKKTDGGACGKDFYEEEVEALGGKVYALPKFMGYNYAAYRKAARVFFEKHHEFAVVQGHMTSTAAIYLPQARRAGVPIVCAHARSAGVDKGIKGFVTKILRLSLLRKADYCLACSGEAGAAVFGSKWSVSPKARLVPNAIDARKFRYDAAVREKVRRELGLGDSTVIGHVGRFHYSKNHEFLMEIFACVHRDMEQKGKRAVLLLLGEGEGMEDAKKQAVQLGVARDVMFLGNRKNVEAYYQAFDLFLFPSRFEGLPGTVVEAQAAGLRCVISDRITREVGVSDLVSFHSIDEPASAWAGYVERSLSYERKDMCRVIEKAGFDVREQAERMEQFYLTGALQHFGNDAENGSCF